MSGVIVLSDSDESLSLAHLENKENDSSSDEFNFPEVQFSYVADTADIPKSLSIADLNCEWENVNFSQATNSQNVNYDNDNFRNFTIRKNTLVHDLSDFEESEVQNIFDKGASTSRKDYPTHQEYEKKLVKKDKNKLKEERAKRLRNLTREKAVKAITSKRIQNAKPENCMKFIKVILDDNIKNDAFHTEILSALKNANIQYKFTSNIISKSIIWSRDVEEDRIDEDNKIHTTIYTQIEKQILIIWNWNEVVEKVIDNSFCPCISNIKAIMPDYTMTLVMFGIQDYFKYHKKTGTRSRYNEPSTSRTGKYNSGDTQAFAKSPVILKDQLEDLLAGIEIDYKCNNRFIDNAEDLALMVYQFTKAIAETPYKLEKWQNLTNKFDWYVTEDNRDCVSIDKNGNGLKRLWQQQLCRFHLSSLEIAEAICSKYKSPVELLEAYATCTPEEGINLLKDIPIRRAAGPLTKARRVGPELSKKIYVMFTSQNGNILLSND